MLANRALLAESGRSVYLRCSNAFFSFAGLSRKVESISLFRCLALKKSDLFIVWFPSIKALVDVTIILLFTSATIVFVYHEPYVSFRSYRSAGFGFAKSTRVLLISCVNRLICKLSHKVVLPSRNAANALKASTADRLKYQTFALLFDDEWKNESALPRNAISYIGTIAEDHAFVEFVRFATQAIDSNDLLAYRFVIATRSAIPAEVGEDVARCKSSGRLFVQAGRPLTNPEINLHFAGSFVVWNAYKRSMQSGVLPKAYMFGSPVIVSDKNESEYFILGKTGAEISSDYRYEDFVAAIKEVALNWQVLSANCRDLFLSVFYYRALAPRFLDFVSQGRP
jgi:hypothetical protein